MSEKFSPIRNIPIGVLSFMLGVGLGYAIERNTDEIASKKIITANACQTTHPMERTISRAFIECTKDGVPGGTDIGDDKFRAGEPVAYVDAYKASQENEKGIELERLVLWGVAGSVVGIADWIL